MKFLGAKPRDIIVLAEHDLSSLEKIKWCLDNCTIDYNGDNKKEVENTEYFSKEFYPDVCDLISFAKQSMGIKED